MNAGKRALKRRKLLVLIGFYLCSRAGLEFQFGETTASFPSPWKTGFILEFPIIFHQTYNLINQMSHLDKFFVINDRLFFFFLVGIGTGPITLNQPTCGNSRNSMNTCPVDDTATPCNHTQDVYIACRGLIVPSSR